MRRLLMVLAGLVGAAGVGALVWLIGWSDVLALEEVHIDGAEGTLEAEVRAAAEPPMGRPLVRVDTDAIADAVGDLPEVADVSVSRSWPRAITIAVQPRIAAAAITDGASWWQVDTEGVLFGNTPERPDGLPVLDAPAGDSPAEKAARVAGVAVITGLPPELADRVVDVSAPTEASVELTLDGGATVSWGTAGEIDRKSEVLLALLDEDASHYDVSAPSNPAIRP